MKKQAGTIPWHAQRSVSLQVTRCRDDVNPAVWGPLDVTIGGYDLALWITKLQKQINFVRREEHDHDASLDGYVADDWAFNPAAFVHRMQDGDRAAEVSAVVDPATGQLVSEPVEVARVFCDHYRSILPSRSRDEEKRPDWITNLYATPKPGIDPQWYAGLMSPISHEDVKAALSSAKYVCAPGQDRISSGIWRVMVQSPAVCSTIALLLSGCLTHRFQPAAAKHAIIVPVVKQKSGSKVLNNFRPISLQCSLYKIVTKVLSTRLGAISLPRTLYFTARKMVFSQVATQRLHLPFLI